MKVKRVDRELVGAILLAKKKAAKHNAQRTKKPNGAWMGNAGSPVYSETIRRAIELHKLEKNGLLKDHGNSNNGVKTSATAIDKAEPKRDLKSEKSILEALGKYEKSFWVRKLVKEKVIAVTVTDGKITITGRTDSLLTRNAVTDCIKDWQKKHKNIFKVENRLAISSEEAAFRSESRGGANDRIRHYAKYHNRIKLS